LIIDRTLTDTVAKEGGRKKKDFAAMTISLCCIDTFQLTKKLSLL